MDLGRIRTLCEKNYIPLKKLASDIGISEQTIHLMLRQNTTKLSTLEAIAQYFDVGIGYFLQTEHEEKETFFEELKASLKFTYEYDIRTLFKVEEERLLKESTELKAFIKETESLIDREMQIDDTILFTRSMQDESIRNLFITLGHFPKEELRRLELICDNILAQLYDILRDETIKPFIREEMFSAKDIDVILKTYFLNDSILLKPKIWLIKKEQKNF